MTREELLDLLKETCPAVDWEHGGKPSSLDVLLIVNELYTQKGIRIPYSCLKAENFADAEAVWKLCEKQL